MLTAVVIAVAIFVIDTITELEIAAAALYGAVVLIAVRIFEKRSVLFVCFGCIALTVLSALVSVEGPSRSTGIVNCLISITVIVTTTYLAFRIQLVAVALQDARAELAHVNRVTTVGELTASIAHEVNQPIAGAVTNADAALRWLNKDPPNIVEARQALEGVTEDGKRASAIINRIRALVTKAPTLKESLDLNEIILEVVKLTRNEVLRNEIVLVIQLDRGLPDIWGDRIQLQQVILNLMLNAIEAMGGLRNGPSELLIATQKDHPNGVLVTVRDTGPGIGPETIGRLFAPFFTTKTGGMGMGLSICRSVVEAHGGRVWAISNTGPGTTFRFRLPARQAT